MNTMKSNSLSPLQKKEKIRILKKAGLFFSVLLGAAASIFVLINLGSRNPFLSSIVKQEDVNQRPLVQPHEVRDDNDHGGEKIDYYKACDLFVGRWIREPKGPLYTNTSCVTIPESKNCRKYGRVDEDYMHWRWKPDECELQRFDANKFLRMARGKTLGFIGDSVARNQMESLLCLLSQVCPLGSCFLLTCIFHAEIWILDPLKGHILTFSTDAFGWSNPVREPKQCLKKTPSFQQKFLAEAQVESPLDRYKDSEDRFRTWYFPYHDFTLKTIWTKFLVAGIERKINGTNSGIYDIHVDKVDPELAKELPNIDYAVISDGHWFFRKTYVLERNKPIGCVFCDDANIKNRGLGYAFKRVFQAVLKHVNECKECKDGLITLVRTFSPAHFEHGTWNDGGKCNRTMPVSQGEVNLGGSEWEIRNIQVEEVERARMVGRNKLGYLDVTKATLMRPDGHPGIHWNNNYMEGYSDCVHWCLPGPIDAWNDLLLAALTTYSSLY
ncbi:hypothetical protein ACLOJK_030987 [Asimina triloba]